MWALGDVLEGMHTAWDRLTTAQGTMRLWYQPAPTRRAYERWLHASPSGAVQTLRAPTASQPESPGIPADDSAGDTVVETFTRFWMAKPWRWRIEQFDASGQELSAEPSITLVIDGAIWWSWTHGDAVHTNSRALHPEQKAHSGVDSALLVMLDPAPLLGTLRLHLIGPYDELNRESVHIEGKARDPQRDPGLWPGADHYTLVVEQSSGTLVSAEATLGERAYAGSIFTDLSLNAEIPSDRFLFELPAGVPVHYL